MDENYITDVDGNGKYDVKDFLNLENSEIIDMNNKKKFDICIQNPPYDKNLHLRFLEKTIQVADTVISIQPIRWLQDLCIKNKETNEYKKYKDSIIQYLNNIDIINTNDARKYFNIGINTDLGIYLCNNNGGYNIEVLHSKLLLKLLNKIKHLSKLPLNENKYDGWRVRFLKVVGGSHTDNNKKDIVKSISNLLYFYNGYKDNKLWYNYYQKNQNTKLTQEIPLSIKFKNENECINFVNSFKTKFILYIILNTTLNTTLNINSIPFMDDYTKEWNDERFYSYFNLTNDEIKEIDKFMEPYIQYIKSNI